MMDPRAIRSFILSVVKPLKVGKSVEQVKLTSTLDSLYPDGGSDDRFTHASPFGFISRIPKGISSFYQELWGSGHNPIVLSALHEDRPVPTGVGEVVIYSTDSSGAQVKVKITLTNDGKLTIDCPSDMSINCTSATLNADTVTVNSTNSTVSASAKAIVDAPAIELGHGALEKIVNGETFLQLYNQHNHIDCFGIPTQPPLMPMAASTHLSATVKAQK